MAAEDSRKLSPLQNLPGDHSPGSTNLLDKKFWGMQGLLGVEGGLIGSHMLEATYLMQCKMGTTCPNEVYKALNEIVVSSHTPRYVAACWNNVGDNSGFDSNDHFRMHQKI